MEEQKPRPVELGGEVFNDAVALSKRLQDLISLYPNGQRLAAHHVDLIIDLVKQGHQAAEEKIGPGVKGALVDLHPIHKKSRCFFLHRTDGTTVDFSYRKCVENLFNIDVKSKEHPQVALNTPPKELLDPALMKPVILRFVMEDGFYFKQVKRKKRIREEKEMRRAEEEERGKKLLKLESGEAVATGEKDKDGQAVPASVVRKPMNWSGKREHLANRYVNLLQPYGTPTFVDFEDREDYKSGHIRFSDGRVLTHPNLVVKVNLEAAKSGMLFKSLTQLTPSEEADYFRRVQMRREWLEQMRIKKPKRKKSDGGRGERGGRGEWGGRGERGGRGAGRGGAGRGGAGRGGAGRGGDGNNKEVEVEMSVDENGKPRRPSGGAVSSIPVIKSAKRKAE